MICPARRPTPPCRHLDLLTATEWTILNGLADDGEDQADLIALMRAEADDCARCSGPILARLAADPARCAFAFQAYTYVADTYWGPGFHLRFGRGSVLAQACRAVEARLEARVATGATITDMVASTLRGDLTAVQVERTAAVRTAILEQLLALARVGRRMGEAHPGGGGHDRPERLP